MSNSNSILHGRFELQVEATPDAPAVTFEGYTHSYNELNRRANCVAHYLLELGLEPGQLVGLCLDRSIDTVVSILAVLKAGGAYVPMDPLYPAERVRMIVDDAQCPMVLAHRAFADRFSENDGAQLVVLDGDEQPWLQGDDSNPNVEANGESLAYVIYTSGSTGRPKGALINHHNVVRLFTEMEPWFGFNETDVWPLFHSYAFDFSVWELWGAFFYGGRLVVVPHLISRSPEAFYELLISEQVTVLNQTPSAFKQLQHYDESVPLDVARSLSLRFVIFGGEILDLPGLKGWFDRHGDTHPKLVNMYGITETTVFVTYRPVSLADTEPGTPNFIGIPIPDLTLHVLDEEGKHVAVGETGELFVGGAGVGLGYLRRPELSAERFIPDPFAPDDTPATLYKTGDLVRLWENDLEFLGRNDFQVQLRGFRVELGEIESTLNAYEAVRGAVVRLLEDSDDQRLVAYYLAKDPVDPGALRTHLLATLPPYMVPSAFVHLEAFPLNNNGKIDMGALPTPTFERGAVAYVAPQTEVEEALVEIWQELLHVPEVGVEDNFFDLGGHSLRATQLIVRVEKKFSVRLSLRTILDNPTIASHAAAIATAEAAGAFIGAQDPIPAADRSLPLPLSHFQEQLWILSKLEPGLTAYNISFLFTVKGPLQIEALRGAVEYVVARQEALRTVFVEENGVPTQRVLEKLEVPVPLYALQEISRERQSDEARKLSQRLAEHAMDLEQGPLFRLELYQFSPEEFQLSVCVHHIVFDGWSISVFLSELAAGYANALAEESGPSSPPVTQYVDFSVWQRKWVDSLDGRKQLDYWKTKLRGPLPVLEVTPDFSRPTIRTWAGAVKRFHAPETLRKAVDDMARNHGVTPFIVMLAGWKALLYRYTGQSDCIVGTAFAGRSRVELEPLIGFFVNTIPLRTSVGRDMSFEKLVGRVDEVAKEAQDNQYVPFERIVSECRVERDPSRTPIFQVLFLFQNTPDYTVAFSGLSMVGEEGANGGAKYDLTLSVDPVDGGYDVSLEYSTSLYSDATAEELLGRYLALLGDATRAPQRPIGQLDLVRPDTTGEAVGGTTVVCPDTEPETAEQSQCLDALFERQVLRTPDAPAVTCEGSTISYRELDARANQLANCLSDNQVGRNTRVGLCLDRSIDTIVSIIGVLKAGASYVPMDPMNPAERLKLVVDDARCPVIITHLVYRDRFRDVTDTKIIILDGLDDPMGRFPATRQAGTTRGEDVAYVMYTSGSTGRPKGVPITHANVARMFTSTDHWFNITPDDIFTLFHSYAFDLSVWEYCGALLYGGRLVVVPYQVSRSPEEFYQLLVDEGVTMLLQTPSAFRQLQFYEDSLPREVWEQLKLRCIVFCGEALSFPCLASWVERHGDERPQLVNSYGITETTILMTYRRVYAHEAVSGTPSYIGVPFPDQPCYVLNESRELVAVGEEGELYVGGAGNTRGYLNRPELTAERFIESPIEAHAGAILYKTGDIVRLLDGDMAYIGRRDNQVQIRGFRVELGEVEAVLTAHDQVRGAVVRVREDTLGDMRLIGYYLADEELAERSLREHLLAKLPEYMVPSRFLHLPAFPMNNNGKIDVSALSLTDLETVPDTTFQAPQSEIEKAIAEIWCSFFKRNQISLDDNFFELGGHSLLGIQVLTKINARLGISLVLGELFNSPTIRALAVLAERSEEEVDETALEPQRLFTLKEGTGDPFFCVTGAGDVMGSYGPLAAALGPEQPFYGYSDHLLEVGDQEDFTVESMAAAFIKEIRTKKPAGPYRLGGYSFGGLLAFEAAKQLIESGEDVTSLIMLDTSAYFEGVERNDSRFIFARFWSRRVLVRLWMFAYTWKLQLGYIRDGAGILLGTLFSGKRGQKSAPSVREYLRWIWQDTGNQYFLIQGRLVTPSVSDRRLEMIREAWVRHTTKRVERMGVAQRDYMLAPIPVNLTLVRVAHDPWQEAKNDETLGWKHFAEKGVDVHVIPGNHMVMNREPYVRELGAVIQRCLDATAE